MEPARPGPSRRRPRRGSAERPIDTRLVRKVALALTLPLLLAFLTVAQPGPLPAPALPPTFDGASALTLTRELARDYPSRVPGSPGADRAAGWVRDHFELYGLDVRENAWEATLPGLGTVRLRNLEAVVRGTLDDTILLVAHRDNTGSSAGANDNASGTAALVEIARAYTTVGTAGAQPRQPLHTLLFLSTDAGAYGSVGAAHFADSGGARRKIVAALSLDGLAGHARPRLELAGLDHRSPAPALVRTVTVRTQSQLGRPPRLPSPLVQLVSLALPFGYGEQAPLLEAGLPTVRLTTAPDADAPPGSDEPEALVPARLARLGAAVESTLGSLDAAVEVPTSTSAVLYLGARGVRGWALWLLLATAVLPFAAASVDLLGRMRRRGVPLRGALRALRRRIGIWLLLGAVVFVAALLGALPTGGGLPAPPDEPPLDAWPLGATVVAAVVVAAVWLRGRAILLPRRVTTEDERIAGFLVAYLTLTGVAVAMAIVNPFSVALVLPSLYAWLWLPHVRPARAGIADLLFGLGLIGPVLVLTVLGEQLDLGARAPLYALSLLTTGVVPWASSLLLVVWAACAAQIASLVAGRYAPLGRASGR